MKVQWPKLFSQAVIWLFAEVMLTVLGLDDIADYSEFIFQDRNFAATRSALVSVATPA